MSSDDAQELLDERLQAEIDLLGELMAAAAVAAGPLPEEQVDEILAEHPQPARATELD